MKIDEHIGWPGFATVYEKLYVPSELSVIWPDIAEDKTFAALETPTQA